MSDNGWVKLHRKMSEWEWYQESKTFHLFVHLLLNANHEEKKWRGQTVGRGQIIVGLHSLHASTGISIQSIRTAFERLKSTNEITIKSTNRFSIITICNYNRYQDNKEEINKDNNKLLNKPTTNQQQQTRSKEVKNLNTLAAYSPHTVGNAPSPFPSPKDLKTETLSLGKKPPPDPNIKTFTDYAFQTFLVMKGKKLHITGGKDGKTIKSLLGTYDIEELKTLWDKFLFSKDEFILKAGFSIGVFRTQVNKLILEKKDWRA